MSEVLLLSPLEFEKIEKAACFVDLPVIIQEHFQHQKFIIDDETIVIPELTKDKARWYIISKTTPFLKIYFVEVQPIIESEEEEEIKEIPIIISCETPTYAEDVYEYPIFRVGLPLVDTHISGIERQKLKDEKQIAKWDYFFPASKSKLIYKHLYLINEFQISKQAYEGKISYRATTFIAVAIVFVCLFFFKFFSLPILLLGGAILSAVYIISLSKESKCKKFLEEVIQRIEEEKSFLENELQQDEVSENQMKEWLKEEIIALDRKAVRELKFPEDKIVRRELQQVEDIGIIDDYILGLKVQEYGFTQPLKTNGKKKIEKEFPYHLQAYIHHNEPLVGVYYIHLLYLTPDKIGISRFFYDFILAKRFGDATKEYYYQNIISIGTETIDTEIFSDLEEWETKSIEFSFPNNELVYISLTDRIALENIRKLVDDKEMEEELSLEDDTPDLDELLHASPDELPSTKAWFILETVRLYWHKKKKLELLLGNNEGMLK